MNNAQVIVTCQVEGFHCWKDCPLEEVAFLRERHRHVFHIKATKTVAHDDRAVEILLLKRQLLAWLASEFGNPCEFGSRSCETLARLLLDRFCLAECEVLEDGECGGRVIGSTCLKEDRYKDFSERSRTHWRGVEVEGRLAGLKSLFLTSLSPFPAIDAPHVFLCPTVVQNEEPQAVEAAVVQMLAEGRMVTVAVKPEHCHKLTPWVRVKAHIMVDISLHGFSWLKPTDTVKVELAPYTTLSSAVNQMVATSPEDYSSDLTISVE